MNPRPRFLRFSLLLLLIAWLTASPQSPTNDPGRLFPVVKDGKWGYIDKTGKMVIAPQFDATDGFSEGLANVRVGQKWGYIDKTGQMVIPPQYDDGNLFSEGLAPIMVGNKAGYSDQGGKIIIAPQYDGNGRFSEGLAAVGVGDKWGFIDKTGQLVIPLLYFRAPVNLESRFPIPEFSEGLVGVGTGGLHSNRTDGYIDTGKTVVPPQYDDADKFSEGLAGCASL